MFRKTFICAALGFALWASTLAATTTEAQSAFASITERYESIRRMLVEDSVDGVASQAEGIVRVAQETETVTDAAKIGVSADDLGPARDLLAEIGLAAKLLETADDLDRARAAFFELSKPLGRLRKLAGVEGTTVFVCPMAKKAWIQPVGEATGNPYMGSGMAACGEPVAD